MYLHIPIYSAYGQYFDIFRNVSTRPCLNVRCRIIQCIEAVCKCYVFLSLEFDLLHNVRQVTRNWRRCSHCEAITNKSYFYTAHNERAIVNDNARRKWQKETTTYVVKRLILMPSD